MYDTWSKPNHVVLGLVVRAILARKFHWHCQLKMAWLNRRETYVFEELGGFRPWIWHVWQWTRDYIEYRPGVCGFCAYQVFERSV
jgi:hypothetical protein